MDQIRLRGALIAAAPMLPVSTLPDLAPATMAPTPSSMATIATVAPWRVLRTYFDSLPPTIWPFWCRRKCGLIAGVVACVIAHKFTKMRCASMTNALNDLSLMMTTWMFCWLDQRPRRMGVVLMSGRELSISASRIIGMPGRSPVCARTGMLPRALHRPTAAAVAIATARDAGFIGRILLVAGDNRLGRSQSRQHGTSP